MTPTVLFQLKTNNLLHQIASLFIILFTFFIPISTTITGICLYAILFCWLFDSGLSKRLRFFATYPLTKPLLILIGLSFIAIRYSPADLKTASGASYHIARLGFIPILAYYLQDEKPNLKKWVYIAFVAALVFTILCTFLKVYGHIPIGKRTYGHDVFKDHIIISYFMAIGTFMLWIGYQHVRSYRTVILGLLMLCCYYFVFLNTGKIGYVILYSCFMLYAWKTHGTKGVLFIVTTFSLLMLVAYQCSDTFSLRVNQLFSEMQIYFENSNATSITDESSFGRRLEFALNSTNLFLQHPIFGFGAGSFKEAYSTLFSADFQVMTSNPHNQYLFIAVEYGLAGLLTMMWLFYCQWQCLQKLTGIESILAQGIFLSFIIGCLLNSWLVDFSECHFYLLMTASFVPIIYKEKHPDILFQDEQPVAR